MSIEDTLRQIIREELQVLLGHLPPLQGETTVDYETRTSEPESETFVLETETTEQRVVISTTNELMAALKELCDGPEMVRTAKRLLSESYPEFPKFSSVTDEMADEVFTTIKEQL